MKIQLRKTTALVLIVGIVGVVATLLFGEPDVREEVLGLVAVAAMAGAGAAPQLITRKKESRPD